MTLTTDRDYKEAYVGKIISDETARVVNQGRSIDKGELASILIGKSRVYDDGDFRQMAVKLIGERGVVKSLALVLALLGKSWILYKF